MTVGSWQQHHFFACFICLLHYNPLPLSEVLLSSYFHLSMFVFDTSLWRTESYAQAHFIL